jgi:hypothetical protein
VGVRGVVHAEEHSLHKQHQHVAPNNEDEIQWILYAGQRRQPLLGLLAVGQQVD